MTDIIVEGNIIKLPLRDKFQRIINFGYVSKEDIDIVANRKFHIVVKNGKEYVRSTDKKYLHELIIGMKAPLGHHIDHIDSNGLNNIRNNLRILTISQNAQNKNKQKGVYSSDYLGVSKHDHRWIASCKGVYVGIYDEERDAAKAYDINAIYYFGKGARTNETLSEDEINNIIINGLPDQYKKAVRDLPKNVYRKNNKYMYKVIRNGVIYIEYFEDLDKCINSKDNLIGRLDEIDRIEHYKKPITYDENGNATIYLHDKIGNIIAYAIIDDFLWHDISYNLWYLSNTGYAIRTGIGSLHGFLYRTYIGDVPEGKTIDHIDRNRLNNKLNNLRVAEPREQTHNQDKSNGICRYKGVSINRNIFRVRIDDICISGFEYEEDAARKYNELALELYGEFAYLNEISDSKTTVKDLLISEDKITAEYIKNINTLIELKHVIRVKGWGGRNGHFKLDDININNIEEYKNKAIGLLENIDYIRSDEILGITTISEMTELIKKYSLNYERGGPYKLKDIKKSTLSKTITDVFDILKNKGYINDSVLKKTKTENMKYRRDDIVNINTIKLFRETVTRNNWSVSSGGPIKIKELRTTNFDENKKILIDWLEKQKLLIQ